MALKIKSRRPAFHKNDNSKNVFVLFDNANNFDEFQTSNDCVGKTLSFTTINIWSVNNYNVERYNSN